MSHEAWMSLAIEKAKEGLSAGQTPFGACIVKDEQLVVAAHNVVWAQTDVTGHAEIHALRLACRKLGSIDLSGAILYSTCEPCPMCFAACHWARLAWIVYGATIADAQAAGFSELLLTNDQMKQLTHTHLQVLPHILRDQCAALFPLWRAHPQHRAY